MSALADRQDLLWRLIREPEGVRAGLDELPEGAERLAATVVSDARLDATARLEIYASAYFIRIHDVLAEDFAALARLLGPDWFNDLVTSYLAVHSPRHYSLREVGDRLPGFLEQDESVASIRERWPFAGELAGLEWTLGRAFDARDARRLEAEYLASLAPEDWSELVLALDPAARLLVTAWPVHRLVDAADPATISVSPEPTRLLVSRPEWSARWRALDEAEHAALRLVAERTTFGAICELAAEATDDEAGPAQAALWLTRWLEDGCIAAGPDRRER